MYCQKRGRRNRYQQQNYYLTSPNLLPSRGNSISPPSAIHNVHKNLPLAGRPQHEIALAFLNFCERFGKKIAIHYATANFCEQEHCRYSPQSLPLFSFPVFNNNVSL